MINSVEIINVNNTPFSYIENGFDKSNSNFSLKEKYEFEAGVNIIVGCNGSGKTTLLNLIRHYTLCNRMFCSDIDTINHYSHFVKSGKGLIDGVKVVADYRLTTFNLRLIRDMKEYEIVEKHDSFVQYATEKSMSNGEKHIFALQLMLKEMFDNHNNKTFPIKELEQKIQFANDLWVDNFNQLLKYYKDNHKDGFQYTVLMDEPDQNLDIENLKQLFGILSQSREDTQIITCLHNPILIYKLFQSKNINFIEMTDNYINSIIDFIGVKI